MMFTHHPFEAGYDLLYDLFCQDEHCQYLTDCGITERASNVLVVRHGQVILHLACLTMSCLHDALPPFAGDQLPPH